jgi:hypothetical protein
MEFALGYLLGSGANWQTILVTLVLIAIVSVVWNLIFGD